MRKWRIQKNASSRVEISSGCKWEAFGGCGQGDSSGQKADPVGKIVAGVFLLDQLILMGKLSEREGNNLDKCGHFACHSTHGTQPQCEQERKDVNLLVLVGFSFPVPLVVWAFCHVGRTLVFKDTIFFLAVPRSMWDLSSLTRVRTCPPCIGNAES